jgi:hypothetical protein
MLTIKNTNGQLFVNEVFKSDGIPEIREVNLSEEVGKVLERVAVLSKSNTIPGVKTAADILEKTHNCLLSRQLPDSQSVKEIVSETGEFQRSICMAMAPNTPNNLFGAVTACGMAAEAVMKRSGTSRNHLLDACSYLQQALDSGKLV